MRIIDADALMEVFRGEEGAKALDHFSLRLIKVKKIVDDAPTIDAIPVEWIHKFCEDDISEEQREAIEWMLGVWQREQEAR